MGDGEFGSNGSLHWKVKYDDSSPNADHVDYDDLRTVTGPAVLGKGSDNSKDHRDFLRVRLRFTDDTEAKSRLEAGLKEGGRIPGVNGFYVFVDVPAVQGRVRPEDDPFWEVKVDW